jgi:hypothetical protein
MPMIGGEMADLCGQSSEPASPALLCRMDEVFASLFAARCRVREVADADDLMRIAPARMEMFPTIAPVAPAWECAGAAPGEVPALAAG